MFRRRNYHPTDSKQSSCFLSCFSSFCSSTSFRLGFHSYAARPQIKLPRRRLKCRKLLKLQAVSSPQLFSVLDRSLFRSLLDRNLTLTSVTKKKWFWNIFSSKYRELTEAPLCLAWVNVISNRRPRLLKSRNTLSATLKGHRKSRIQPNSKMFSPKCFKQEVNLI